jgi:hypothetical protein
MPLLRKEIIPAGKYSVVTPQGRVLKEFTPSYLRHISKTANKMVKSGLRIPTPFGHSKDATPHASDNPANNAGYWNRFWVSTENGKPGLWGEVDVPGTEEDPNSPYYKAKHTAKETSVCIHENYVDGKQRKWQNALMHVALVNHPVVPNQKDFEHVPDNTSVVNMSMLTEKDPTLTVPDISGLIKKLRDVCKIYVPDNTTPETFIKDLAVAVGQYELCPPGRTEGIDPVPVYMSTQIKDSDMPLSQDQIKSIVESGTINPVTGKAYVAEDFNVAATAPSPEDKKVGAVLKAFTNKFIDQARSSVTNRINSLIESGRITKEYAEKHLHPKVEFQMSLVGTQDNPEIADHPLEVTLSALEALPTPASAPNLPHQFSASTATSQDNPLFVNSADNMSEEQISKAVDEMLAHLPN